jgi:CubicO group peptidase (beta-lactamase class C family)
MSRAHVRRAALSSLLLIAPTALAVFAAPAAEDPRFQPLRETMKRASTEHRLPSIAVAVAQGGKVVFEEAIGWADVERRVAATPETPYALGGVTQLLTASAVMMLADRGKLALDRPADEYLDARARLTAYEGRADEVTLRRLLTHSAGLPPYEQLFYSDRGELPPATRVTIRRYGIVAAPPGEGSVESTLGYVVLGSLAARVARKDYVQLVNVDLLAGLDLSHTVLAGARGVEGAAVAYGDDLRPLPRFSTGHVAASAGYASLRDLVRFGMLHLRDLPVPQTILKGETIAEMQRAGLGWVIRENDHGYRRVERGSGAFPGATAHLALIPQEHVAVAVLANGRAPAAAEEMVDQALAIVLPRFGAALAAEPRPAPATSAVPRFVPDEALQGTWDGVLQTWEAPLPLALTVERGGAVRIKLGPQPEAAVLEPRVKGGVFTGRVESMTIPTPDAKRSRQVVELVLKLREPRLAGWASAVLNDGRPYGSLASRVELWRPGTRPSPTPTPSPSPTPSGVPEEPPPASAAPGKAPTPKPPATPRPGSSVTSGVVTGVAGISAPAAAAPPTPCGWPGSPARPGG